MTKANIAAAAATSTTQTPTLSGVGLQLALYFLSNPDETLSRRDIATKFSAAAATLDDELQPVIAAGLVRKIDDKMEGKLWVAGPGLRQWKPPAVSTWRGGMAAAAPQPAARTRQRHRLPGLDLSAVQVRADVPLPPKLWETRKGRTLYDDLFNQLTADGMSLANIPQRYAAALGKAATAYLKHRPALAASSVLKVRRLADGTCGVWRLARTADDDAPPAPPQPAPAKKAKGSGAHLKAVAHG